MTIKYNMYDILVYNSQGTIKVGAITKITILGEDILYEMDSQEVIREDIIMSHIGNMKVIKEQHESN